MKAIRRRNKRRDADALNLKPHSPVKCVTLSFFKESEGGMGQKDAMYLFKCAGIPCRRSTSIYMGHTAVDVPKRFAKRAERILFR